MGSVGGDGGRFLKLFFLCSKSLKVMRMKKQEKGVCNTNEEPLYNI